MSHHRRSERTAPHALGLVLRAVPLTTEHAAERRSPRRGGCVAGSSRTREHARTAEIDLDRDVADQPRAVGAAVSRSTRPSPEAARPRARSRGRAAGSRRRRRTRRRRAPPPRAGLGLRPCEVGGAQRLVAVLAAADVEEVVGAGVDGSAEAGAGSSKPIRATRSACATARGCRGRRRCSSGRDRARTRAGRLSHGSHHHLGADVLGRLGAMLCRLGAQAVLGGLARRRPRW